MQMRGPEWYLDQAKTLSGVKSDRQLCDMVEQGPSWAAQIRTGRAFPSDDAMMKLAKIAGIDPYVALLDLNTWRSEGEARKTYLSLLKKVTMAVIVLIFMGFHSGPAYAGIVPVAQHQQYQDDTLSHQPVATALSKLYIITSKYIRKARNFLCKWLA